jgi:hypothetical protein
MRGPTLFRIGLILSVLATSAQLWTIRPQVISLALFAVVMLLITQQRWWLVPLLMLVWANLHGGVMLGLAAVGAALVVRVLRNRETFASSLATLTAAAAMACLTPLGLTIWTELPEMLNRLRLYDVQEWRPPTLLEPLSLPFFIAAAAIMILTLRRWRSLDDRAAMIVGAALALLPLACKSTRNIGPFLLVGVPALSVLLAHRADSFDRPEHSRRGLSWSLACATLGICVSIVVWTWSHPRERLNWQPVPTAVAQAVAGCRGNLYNQYDNGGYLVWFVPQTPVFMDSRQDPFPPDLVLAHLDVEATGDYRQLFDRFGIGCAALPSWSPTARRLRDAGWRVTAQDRGWIVLQDSSSMAPRKSAAQLARS